MVGKKYSVPIDVSKRQVLVYLGDGKTDFTLELTWLKDRKEPYDLGEGEFHPVSYTHLDVYKRQEFHLCMRVDGDYEEVRAYHRQKGWICYENKEMGLYFIADPDGYWIEILPDRQ